VVHLIFMKRGFLLMNTGSPDAPTKEAVRRYLKAFLMDPHVIDLPWPLRALLVHGVILPRHAAESAKKYKAIWTENGSPLVHSSQQLANGLGIELGMLYGEPSHKEAIERLLASGAQEIVLLPLFPHQAMAPTGACIAAAEAAINKRATLRVLPPFHTHPAFIQPLAQSLTKVDEHILFSYHGLPLRHLEKMESPDYRFQCLETTQAIAAAAGIPEERYSVAFQSRMGRAEWTQPYSEEVLEKLPSLGKTRLAVICPSFFCDCLETLEEIGMRGREIFLAAGGESFRLIPCLNHSPAAFQCLENLLNPARD
jgi:ferrochelatase